MYKVLVACEESQRVCMAWRELGHERYSCDLIECSGGHPEWHIQGDCLPLLKENIDFTTVDGTPHHIDRWDVIIAHPPCTYLTISGNRWFNVEKYGEKAIERMKLREEAIEFFMNFTRAEADHIAIENPVGVMSTKYRKPDCIYNPYDFYPETDKKRTCLWLKDLPPLKPNQVLPKEQRTTDKANALIDGKYYRYHDPYVALIRSKTPIGVAKAMAEQWSAYLEGKDVK